MSVAQQSKTLTLTYQKLSANYPKPPGQGGQPIGGLCKPYVNQCAIRLSQALAKAGLSLSASGYSEPVCRANGIVHARGAESLANFLWKKLGRPTRLASCASDKPFKGKKGIIFFKDIKGFRGGRGDHIDLWDGAKTKGYNGFGACTEVWFWSLPRTVKI